MVPGEGYAEKGRSGDPGLLWYRVGRSGLSLDASVAGEQDEEDSCGDITGRPRWTEAEL